MIPSRYAHIAFSIIVSGVMSLLVSGVATFRAMGWFETFIGTWLASWLNAWAIAFPTLFLVGPLARRIVAKFTRPE